MRIQDLLSEERAAVPPKPRNFVAKNAKMGGAGQHKDKKKAEKQGDVKHKKELAAMESQGVAEVSLGDYRKKATMQKAKSQMGAMFNNDPEKQKQHQATFDKRERGLDRLKARDDLARKTTADKQMADNIAKLPELKAEYERMKAEYTLLGGSNWQYADREQNLTDRERKARSMEGPMNNLWRTISAAEKAQKSESVDEGAMSELDIEIGDMLDGYIAKYQDGLLDADHLGAMIDKVAAKLSQEYHTDQNDMARHVSNYVADAVGEE